MIVNADAKSLEIPKENLVDYDNPSWHGNTTRLRFLKKIKQNPITSCWEWQGTITGNNGYGSMRIPGRQTAYVHRIAYVMYKEPIILGMQVLHACDNPICCNPDHLFLGTQEDNIKDRDMKGRQRNKSSVKYLGYVASEKEGKL